MKYLIILLFLLAAFLWAAALIVEAYYSTPPVSPIIVPEGCWIERGCVGESL